MAQQRRPEPPYQPPTAEEVRRKMRERIEREIELVRVCRAFIEAQQPPEVPPAILSSIGFRYSQGGTVATWWFKLRPGWEPIIPPELLEPPPPAEQTPAAEPTPSPVLTEGVDPLADAVLDAVRRAGKRQSLGEILAALPQFGKPDVKVAVGQLVQAGRLMRNAAGLFDVPAE